MENQEENIQKLKAAYDAVLTSFNNVHQRIHYFEQKQARLEKKLELLEKSMVRS